MLKWLVVVGLVLVSEPAVSIRVSAPVLMAGYSLQVTCKVPRNPDNRELEVGVTNYRLSTVQLDGEDSPTLHTILFLKVPCEATAAYCIVRRNDRTSAQAAQRLTLAGCNEN